MDLSLMKSVMTEELPSLLERASKYGGRLTQPNLEPLQTSIVGMEIRPDGRLVITMLDALPLEEDRGLLIDLNYRDLFFRLNPGQFFLQKNLIFATMPNTARALTKRSCERYLLPPELMVRSSLQRIEVRDREKELRAEVIDVSRNGLALHFGPLQDGTLVFNDHVWIKEINHLRLESPLFGKVVYATYERTGIALDQEMPEDLLEHLKSLSKTVLGV